MQFFQDAATIVCIFVTRCSTDKSNVLAASFNKKTYHGDFINEVQNALQTFPPETFAEEPWSIRPTLHTSILNKMDSFKTALKDLPIDIYRGVLTGFNDAFIIGGETRNSLISEDDNSAELIKPLLRGRDITPWSAVCQDLYLINTHNGLKEKNIPPVNIDNYPAVKKHLDQYIVDLTKRGDKGDTPYNLRNCAYLEEFAKPKIIYPEITNGFPFCYDETGMFCNNKAFIITAKDELVSLKYLTAIFNSKLVKLWIWYKCPELLGGTREIRKAYFENLRIPDANNAELAALADKMLTLNADLQQKVSRFLRRITETYNLEKTTAALETFYTLSFSDFVKELGKQKVKLTLVQKDELEDYFNAYQAECQSLKTAIATTDHEIDRMVYALYGLTDEEIGVVEN